MTSDDTIFGLRFRSNEKLQPSLEDLKLFLATRGKAGTPHNDDLAAYRELLKAVDSRQRGKRSASTMEEYREIMLYGVLNHSHLIEPALKLAVEQYKYHVHALSRLDFKKPTAFVRSAEEELAKLNLKKKDEASRGARMKIMIDDRKRDIDKLTRQWLALAEELGNLADYITDNLGRIERLCESSIAVLVSDQLGGEKKEELIEDLKAQFKARLREFLHEGTITKLQLEKTKEDVAEISRRLSDLLREDMYALTGLYETIHERVGSCWREIHAIQEEIGRKRHVDFQEDLKLYDQMESVLLKLVADPGLTVRISEMHRGSEHDEIAFDKRQEMLAHLFDLLRSRAQP